ncbi:hypothetical protein RRG08_034011 [Elysia crispata]|uniref:Uncharacterized protein n=1 Tax=Elysia crispata TaxID=231223 RepID=A0AAE0XRA5_9GAST|nr:hypothetical protein RRG08_034011 [Elysia crispata]
MSFRSICQSKQVNPSFSRLAEMTALLIHLDSSVSVHHENRETSKLPHTVATAVLDPFFVKALDKVILYRYKRTTKTASMKRNQSLLYVFLGVLLFHLALAQSPTDVTGVVDTVDPALTDIASTVTSGSGTIGQPDAIAPDSLFIGSPTNLDQVASAPPPSAAEPTTTLPTTASSLVTTASPSGGPSNPGPPLSPDQMVGGGGGGGSGASVGGAEVTTAAAAAAAQQQVVTTAAPALVVTQSTPPVFTSV